MNNNGLHFSVVIPLYNKKWSVMKSVESVLMQTCRNLELIVVDDGSNDGSAETVQNIPDGRIRLIRQSNAGVSAARNRGIEEAKYNHIALLDADDFWEPQLLDEMAGLIRDFPEAGLYGCAFDRIYHQKPISVNFFLPKLHRNYIDEYFDQASKHHLFWSSAVVINKDILLPEIKFDPKIAIGEDLDFWFRIALHHRVVFYNKVLAHYNEDADNRAMRKRHAYAKSIHCYLGKYLETETHNESFRIFINQFRIRKLPEVKIIFGARPEEIKKYRALIDVKGQPLVNKIYLHLPLPLIKLMLKSRERIRNTKYWFSRVAEQFYSKKSSG